MDRFIQFLIKSSEQDLLWYLRFDALIYNHYNSEWDCHRLSERDLEKYINLKKQIFQKYDNR